MPQKKLVRNGGLLDEVVFIPETHDEEHLEWFDSIVNQTTEYSQVVSGNMPIFGIPYPKTPCISGSTETCYLWKTA